MAYSRPVAGEDDRAIAVELYNRSWELLEDESRGDDGTAELLSAAFASRLFWRRAGGPEQWIVSDWMVARAAGAAGYGDLAWAFATRAHAATDSSAPDWLHASVAEGVARAAADRGDERAHAHWCTVSRALVEAIVDDEDRNLIAAQLSDTASRTVGA